jgi:hypothetical protein
MRGGNVALFWTHEHGFGKVWYLEKAREVVLVVYVLATVYFSGLSDRAGECVTSKSNR